MAENYSHKPLIALFPRWYVLQAPLAIVRGTLAYMRAIAEIIPFGFLLLTLLSPWKNIVDRRPMHGIDLKKITEKLSLGLLARLVGCVVRLLTIALGLVFEIFVIIAGILMLAVWLAFPVIFVLGISFALHAL